MKTLSELRGYHGDLSKRLTALHGLGVNNKDILALCAGFEQAAKSDATPMMLFDGKETPLAEVTALARKKVPAAILALQALRMENVDTYIRATSNFSLFFETVTLKKNEQPVIMNTYRTPVNVRYIGEDGGAQQRKAVRAQQPTYFNMRELHSDKVGYQIRDINQGDDIAATAAGTVDIAWDLKNKVDVELFNFMNGGTINGNDYGSGVFGAFKTTGKNIYKTFVPHPRINLSNLPSTNLIANTDIAALDGLSSNKFRFGVFMAIIKYCDSWGDVLGGEPLQPTGAILVPSSETTGLLTQVNPTGQFSTKVGETVLNSYTKVEYGGRVWTLIGDPTLPPGACYPVLNRKVGNLYLKPEYDLEEVDTNVMTNWETREAMKVLAIAGLEPWRVGALKVVYSSLAGAGVVTNNE